MADPTQVSNFFLDSRKKQIKRFGSNKKIGEATGKILPGGGVPVKKAGDKGSADFRQVGKSSEDKSGFRVQHLGDKK